LLGPIVYIDLVGKDDETAKELLLSGVKGQTPARIEPPTDQLLQKYFDQIKEKYGKITLLGETETHELKRVFVELTINESFSRPTANSEWLGMWDAEFRKRYQPFASRPDEEREAPRRVKPEELLKRRQPAVIAGAPGCGKTTLMRWLALQVCDGNSKRIPIFVELKSLSQKSFESADVRLESVLFDHAAGSLKKPGATESLRQQLREEFSRRLKSGEIVALLDGLDEVRGWEHFHHLCDAINLFAEHHGNNLIIISSRPFALRDRRFGNSQGAEEMEIAPFNRDQIALFLDHYYGEDEGRKLLPKLMSPDLRDLVSVPTLIGAIVRRIRESGKVETDRLKLYEAIVADLAGKFDSAKNVRRFKQNDEAAAMRRQDFLAQLAFTRLFDETLDQGKNAERLVFTTDDIKAEAQRFCREHRTNVDPFELAAEVIATPLLAEMAEDVWKFSHLTLQEYLAAKALAAHPDCENIFVRACFHPLLVEMETLPIALGRVRNPDRLYETLEQLPESLDHKLLRLRARGLASAKVQPQTLQRLLHRLDDFITSEKTEEAHYFDAVVQAFAQARGEALDAVALGVAARLDSANNSSVRGSVAQVLGSFGSDRAVDALLKALLEDQESRVRWRAASALGSIGSERAVDALLKALLEDQESDVRWRAAEALGSIGSERAVDALLNALLEDQESFVQESAAKALGSIGSERAVGSLFKALLEVQESGIRGHAAEALGSIGSERAVDALLKALLEDQGSSVRWRAAQALGSIGSERAVDGLLKALLEDQGSSVRWSAAEALGSIGSERAVDAMLKALLEDQESGVRGHAAKALGSFGSERAVDALLKALLEDQESFVRGHAAEALGSIGSERAVNALLKALLEVQESGVRGYAAEALGSFGSERAMDALLKALLEDQESGVRWRAAEALGSIGDERAVDALLKALLEDQEAYVRWRAAKALGSIGSERAVDALLKALLEDQGSYVQEMAASALGNIGSDRAVDALFKALLEVQGSEVRARAAEALGRIGSDRTVDALLKALLEVQEAYVRGRAAKALGNIAAEKPGRFAAGLMLALDNEKKSVRRKAAEVVGYYVNEPCLAELERLAASDRSKEVKEAARAAAEKVKRKLRYFGADAA
jgi:HEAT repeat protein